MEYCSTFGQRSFPYLASDDVIDPVRPENKRTATEIIDNWKLINTSTTVKMEKYGFKLIILWTWEGSYREFPSVCED